ncbi:hypothetical protein AAFF_G00341460 [Aldrovandia affinis]|uniref:Uncharacterized protein n=1 Tax=Aldrovandia affinis TaxID=143900 RepID=A0AAD7SLC1_9TELE|nr:hypothetical protein AAFF_G00341460 [Aldrovandia affinis]
MRLKIPLVARVRRGRTASAGSRHARRGRTGGTRSRVEGQAPSPGRMEHRGQPTGGERDEEAAADRQGEGSGGLSKVSRDRIASEPSGLLPWTRSKMWSSGREVWVTH